MCWLPRNAMDDPAALVQQVFQTTGQAPDLIKLGEVRGGRLKIDETSIPAIVQDEHNEMYFLALGRFVKEFYVGEVTTNVPLELQQCKQVYVSRGKVVDDTVANYFQRFNATLDIADPTTPYGLQLAATFVGGAKADLQRQMTVAGWVNPPDPGADNALNESQLLQAKMSLLRAELAVANVKSILNQGGSRGRAGPGSFVAEMQQPTTTVMFSLPNEDLPEAEYINTEELEQQQWDIDHSSICAAAVAPVG